MKTLTIDSLVLKGKTALIRVDFNVPMTEDLKVADTTRIVESLPTIRKILESGGSTVLMSHLGRPKGIRVPEYSLRPVADILSRLLGKPVKFADDCIGTETSRMVQDLQAGECLLLENLRFYAEEEANDARFASELAHYGDYYVNDAFGTAHRAHASTVGVTEYLRPAVAGYLLQKELDYLGKAVGNPARPYVAILGGAKISGKLDVIQNLLSKVDTLIVGGGMAFTFFQAQGIEIGDSLVEQEKLGMAKDIINSVKSSKRRMILPVDCVIADRFDNKANHRTVPVQKIPPGWRGLDIGPDTVKIVGMEIRKAKTVVWNGPMGVFEMDNFAKGTIEVAKLLAQATSAGAVTIVGGGDSAAAIAKAGLEKSVSHVSTGGGASLEFLEGKVLPGVAALDVD